MTPAAARSLAAAALCSFAIGQEAVAGAPGEALWPWPRGGTNTTWQEASRLAADLAQARVGQVMQFGPPAAADGGLQRPIVANLSWPWDVPKVPVVLMHGMGDFADNTGMQNMQRTIARELGIYVRAVALCKDKSQYANCAGEDQHNGFFMTMDDQVDQFARVVRSDPQLAKGFHALGLSQGNLVIRGYIHRYNDPPVRAFVSVHGPQMGVAGLPHCDVAGGLAVICRSVAWLTSFGAYTGFVQDRLAQANYYRDPARLEEFRGNAHFLPYINNEVKSRDSPRFANNFRSLRKLVLVMADDDSMVQPKESAHFGYFSEGSRSDIVAMRQAPWYTGDWFGLRTLDEARKIDFHHTRGDHLQVSVEFILFMARNYFAPGVADLHV